MSTRGGNRCRLSFLRITASSGSLCGLDFFCALSASSLSLDMLKCRLGHLSMPTLRLKDSMSCRGCSYE